MEDGKKAHKAHVLVIPYPSQGHINPMLQFSKRLASKGIKSTLATTVYLSKSMHTITGPSPAHQGPLVQIRTFSDGFDEGGRAQAESGDAYFASLRTVGWRTLVELMKKLSEATLYGLVMESYVDKHACYHCYFLRPKKNLYSCFFTAEGDPVTAIIYDGFIYWALDLAKQYGLLGVVFFTQSCAVNSVYYNVQRGLIQLPISGPGPKTVSVPGGPELQLCETPSFVHKYGSYPFWFDVLVKQFSNIDQADWVLCNIFYEMEKETVDWMAKLWRIKTIGPTVPSHYLDRRLEDDKDYTLHLLKPNAAVCKAWLDAQPKGSVVYVSFGSASDPPKEQFEEMARGLQGSRHRFLWVVREPHQEKLPDGFAKEVALSGSGLIVSWASQLEALTHEATGCFVTHCGFNSILEALSLGVPLVGVPVWTDQGTNAKYVEDVWGVGVRARADERGIVTRERIDKCVREVMEGEKREEIMKNVGKWKELAKQAVDVGGSSDNNIDDFVAFLSSKCYCSG